ncbi:MAG: hypothetical protein U0235_19900 [Polyangiaceae bacterium]
MTTSAPTFDAAEPTTLRLRVPLAESRSERGLARALDALVDATRALPRELLRDKSDPKSFFFVTFHTPERRWVSERRFFERAARFPSLAARTVAYAEHLNPSLWKKDPFFGAGLWTSIMAPAGSHAIVPLVLRDAAHVPALITHLRGADLDHETFQRALIAELVKRHGLREEILDLIAFRAVDGAGQHGPQDRAWLVTETSFGAALTEPSGLEQFAARVAARSTRSKKNYRSLYVSNAGRGLFRDWAHFDAWIAYFARKGLAFEASERAHEPIAPCPPPAFAREWEECASSDDRD